MREPLTWTKKRRLRRWVLKELAREHGALLRAARDQGARRDFTHHATARQRAGTGVRGDRAARAEVASLVLLGQIEATAWDAAYQGMRVEIAGKLAALGLPVEERSAAAGDRRATPASRR